MQRSIYKTNCMCGLAKQYRPLNFFFFYLSLRMSVSMRVSHSVVSDSLKPHGHVACQASLSMEFSRQQY